MSAENTIIERAWKDEEFKSRLISDPKSVLREMGENVPDFLDIKVVEEAGNTRYFILPQDPNAILDGQVLTDDELDAVAGGAASWCSVALCSGQDTK